jgi:hypothetical protein
MKQRGSDTFSSAMRWAQLTLAENDPATIDIPFWLDYFRSIHADAVVLSTGGYVAYHQTRIPFHHKSAWLRGRDLFGELVAGCRKQGMMVVARCDAHAVRRDMYQAHPEWVAEDIRGNKMKHRVMNDVWLPCSLGPYNFNFMTDVIREIVREYRVEAVFVNRWTGTGTCHCEHCRNRFRRDTGLDPPTTEDVRLPEFRRFIGWRREGFLRLAEVWDEAIREIDAAAHFVPNLSLDLLTAPNLQEIARMVPMAFVDKQARAGLMPPWYNGRAAKEMHAAFAGKPVGGIFSVGIEEKQRWKDSVTSEAELRIWVAECIAGGMRPWFTKFCADLHDRRWLPFVKDIFGWHDRFETYLRNTGSVARVGLVVSRRNHDFYGGSDAKQKVEWHLNGAYHALVEARVPFDIVNDQLLDERHLSKYRTLILSNVAALSDAQCAHVRAFVRSGGRLLATFETSLYNEEGERRSDFGLADLFGVHAGGRVEGPMKNSYLTFCPERTDPHVSAILKGFEGTDRIVNGVYRVPVIPVADDFCAAAVGFEPPYPDLPMEEVYVRRGDHPAAELFLREVGDARVAYVPWDFGRSFWEFLSADHQRLFTNVLRWVHDEPQPVNVEGPGVVDVFVWRQARSLTVHLVNLTNPMMLKGPYRELLPLRGLSVAIRLPAGQHVESVRLLKANTKPRFTRHAEWLAVKLPPVRDHEIVAVDLREKVRSHNAASADTKKQR